MPYVNNDTDKSYASSGVGTAALTTGIIGTAGLAISNGLLGNLFGGNNQNPTASPVYQLAQKDTEIAQLKAQQYSDNKVFALSEKVAGLESKIVAIETASPLREQIFMGGLSNLAEKVNGIVRYCVPNYALNPGYGPAMVAPGPFPFPPVVAPTVNGGTTTTTPTTSTAATA